MMSVVLHRRLATMQAPAAVLVSAFARKRRFESDPLRDFFRDLPPVPRICELNLQISRIMQTGGRVPLSISNRAESSRSVFDRFGDSMYQGRGAN